MRETALPLLLCGLLVPSGCSLFGGSGTPSPTATPTGSPTPTETPTPTFGPSVYDAADAQASTDRLREAGSWSATLVTRYESNRSRPDLDEYPIELTLRANASTGHRSAVERRADGRTETTFVDDPGELPLAKVGYERLDGEVVAVYEANASEVGFDIDRSLLVPDEARLLQYEQRLSVTRDGRLVRRSVTISWVHPDREEAVTYSRTFRLTAVGNVTVERPDWVSEARATEDESTEET